MFAPSQVYSAGNVSPALKSGLVNANGAGALSTAASASPLELLLDEELLVELSPEELLLLVLLPPEVLLLSPLLDELVFTGMVLSLLLLQCEDAPSAEAKVNAPIKRMFVLCMQLLRLGFVDESGDSALELR
jgi:hypothetical protein